MPPPSAQNRTSQQSTTLQNSFNRPKILWQLQKLHQFGTVLDLVDKNSSKKTDVPYPRAASAKTLLICCFFRNESPTGFVRL